MIPTDTAYESCLFDDAGEPSQWREVRIHFPLYKGVKEVYIGLKEQAKVIEPTAYISDKKVIFYGTSITQGG